MKRSQRNGLTGNAHTALALALTGALTLALFGCNEDVDLSSTAVPEEVENVVIPPVETQDAETIAQIVRGGALYGNWMTEADVAVPGVPATDATRGMYILMLDHADNVRTDDPDCADSPTVANCDRFDQSGATSYRCKTCHGWDYKGVDGQYGDPSSSNYTGFKGILDAAQKYTVEELESIIGVGVPHPDNPDIVAHAFGAWLEPEDITALALFVKYGLVDTDEYILGFSGWVKPGKGDAARGQELYDGRALGDCAGCHGDDGTAYDFGGGEVVGTIGLENPWEMLHVIRFGHPGPESPEPEMPALYENPDLTTQDAVDITAYTQTLPTEP